MLYRLCNIVAEGAFDYYHEGAIKTVKLAKHAPAFLLNYYGESRY